MTAEISHCTVSRSPEKLKSSTGIFNLNNDCLAEVLSYLPINDVFRVYQTDQDFQEAARLRFAMGGVELIDQAFLADWPKPVLNAFLRSFGKTCHTIKLKLLPEDEFLRVISNFKNLKHLILIGITVSQDNIPEGVLPDTLKSLELHHCILSEKLLDEWIPKLNSNLISLQVVHKDKHNFGELRALSSLHNLSSFVADGMIKRHGDLIAEILANNRNTLTSLTMVHDGYRTRIPEGVWKNIIQLDQLTKLHLCHDAFVGVLPSGLILFPKLNSLRINFGGRQLKSTIECLGCEETLTSLAIEDYDCNYKWVPVSSFKRFKNLRHLELMAGDWSGRYDVMNLVELTQIHTLSLKYGIFDLPCDVCDVISELTFLKKLFLEDILIQDNHMDVEQFKQFARIFRGLTGKPLELKISLE